MAIDFPLAPVTDDIFTDANGVKWVCEIGATGTNFDPDNIRWVRQGVASSSMDKITPPVLDNLVSMDAIGNAKDSGVNSSEVVLNDSIQALHLTDALSISGSTISLNKADGSSEDVVVPGGGIGEFISNSVAISSNDLALVSDDGTTNGNIGIGDSSSRYVTTGSNNVGIGSVALQGDATGKLTGDNNIGIGASSGQRLTTGYNNTFLGEDSGFWNSTGFDNIGIGTLSMEGEILTKVTGNNNVGVGKSTLSNISTGSNNCAIGAGAGNVTTGDFNLAMGSSSLGSQGAGVTGNSNATVGNLSMAWATSGENNLAMGGIALQYLTTGSNNIAMGYSALLGDFTSKLTGDDNIGIGKQSGSGLTSGYNNILLGEFAGFDLDAGHNNVALGLNSLSYGTGSACLRNIAIGEEALQGDTTSGLTTAHNIGIGYKSGHILNTGQYNVYMGIISGLYATSGSDNVGIGSYALQGDSTTKNSGSDNIGIGGYAGSGLTTGYKNIYIGRGTGSGNKTGYHNIGFGNGALNGASATTDSSNHNIGIGYQAGNRIDTGTYNVLIGSDAGNDITSGNKNVCIGYLAGNGVTTGSSKLHIADNGTESLIEGDFVAKTVDINGAIDATNISDAAGNSTIVKRTSSGYIRANYFNTTASDTTTTPTHVYVETGSDGYIRPMTFHNFSNKLIAYGSNANGEYWKFEEGLMICSNTGTETTDYSSSNLFGSTAGTVYNGWSLRTFPVAFYAIPQVGVSGGYFVSTRVEQVGTSTMYVAISYRDNAYTETFSWVAVGRWKA